MDVETVNIGQHPPFAAPPFLTNYSANSSTANSPLSPPLPFIFHLPFHVIFWVALVFIPSARVCNARNIVGYFPQKCVYFYFYSYFIRANFFFGIAKYCTACSVSVLPILPCIIVFTRLSRFPSFSVRFFRLGADRIHR